MKTGIALGLVGVFATLGASAGITTLYLDGSHSHPAAKKLIPGASTASRAPLDGLLLADLGREWRNIVLADHLDANGGHIVIPASHPVRATDRPSIDYDSPATAGLDGSLAPLGSFVFMTAGGPIVSHSAGTSGTKGGVTGFGFGAPGFAASSFIASVGNPGADVHYSANTGLGCAHYPCSGHSTDGDSTSAQLPATTGTVPLVTGTAPLVTGTSPLAAPEIDSASAASCVTLLLISLSVLRGGKKKATAV